MNRPARSLLFVPGDRPERFAKAHASGADAVILDLEDAVAPAAKAAAREACRQHLAGGGAALLRINALDSAWANDDLELSRLPGVQGVVLPKADGASAVQAVAQRSGKPVLPLIESAPGLTNLREIAAARGVSRLLFGSVDLCLDLGIEGDEDELASHRAQLVLVSRAAGLQAPVDGVTLTLTDEAALQRASLRARRNGFGGKLCIHPRQVDAVNRAFEPSQEKIDWARQVLALAENHAGAFQFEGKMVDAPVLALAHRLLAAAGS